MLCEMVRRRPRERQKLSAVKLDRLRLRSPGCGKRKKTAPGLVGRRSDPHFRRLVFDARQQSEPVTCEILDNFPIIPGSADLFPGYGKIIPGCPATGICRQTSELSSVFRAEPAPGRAESKNSRLFSRFTGICPRSAPRRDFSSPGRGAIPPRPSRRRARRS